MIVFIFRRLILLLITVGILSLVSFSLSYYTHHSPLNGDHAWEAYLYYATQLLHGDFGISNINGQPIFNQLKIVFPATMELCLSAFILALVLGIPLGIIAGVNQGKWPDMAISSVALLGFSIPVFWLALLLMLLFSLDLGWLPVSGRYDLLYEIQSVTGLALVDAWLSDSPYRINMIWSVVHHMILPITTLTIAPTTEVIRLMRIRTSDIYEQNYIKAATTRGLSRIAIIRRHLLRNALPPIISKLGLQFSSMLTLVMLTEVVFNWPGIGRWLVIAIRQQDYAAISAGVLTVGTLVIIVNVLSDIFGVLTNPLRHKEWYAFR